MKKEIKVPALFAATLLGAAGCCPLFQQSTETVYQNPMKFPFYTQTVTVEFATPEDAANAVGTIAPLPCGKKAAFTTRWDDTNPEHLKQAQTLAKNGMHGLFLMNDLNENGAKKYFLPAKKLGSAFGNHAFGHALVYHHTPNHLFEAIAIHQAKIESTLDMPSVAFAFPCGLAGLRELYGNAPQVMQEVFRRAGIYSYPERKGYMQELKMAPDTAFATNLFTANDRDPDPEAFRRGFRNSLQAALTDPDTPRITFGIHTWQNAEGFRTLDTLYKEIANRPDLWYCTENQYAAYRYNFYHATVKKTAVDGKKASFTIRRCEPAFSGSASDLSLTFSVPAITAGNYAVVNGTVILPESAGHAVPETIDAVTAGEHSGVFPGLSIGLKPENDGASFVISVENKTDETLENVTASLLLPLRYANGIHRQQIASIGAGEKWEIHLNAGAQSDDPIFSRDREVFRVQLDFTSGGKTCRLHAIQPQAYQEIPEAVFRDTALVLGPFPKGKVKDDFCKEASMPDRALPPAGNAVNLLWRIPAAAGGMPFTVIPFANFLPGEETVQESYEKAVADCTAPTSGQILLAVDFESDGAIRLLHENRVTKEKAFWIDGVCYDDAPLSQKIDLQPGKHRLVIQASAVAKWAIDANRFACGILNDSTGKPVKCYRP